MHLIRGRAPLPKIVPTTNEKVDLSQTVGKEGDQSLRFPVFGKSCESTTGTWRQPLQELWANEEVVKRYLAV
jgi:hypothetical protein